MSDEHQQKITEVLPKAGLVYSEKGNLSEVLSKPKIMPLKSVTLERIEEMEKQAAQITETMERQGRQHE
jgi:BBSome-interacting protein 1|eukprot:CAMPEP_0181374502 /NCGR_PEP_ID=MMETSP1106-20121128/16066_1 /TAXON_ID=81844 /ORGANISM="Mantoniella antarctica, Strain SL-175" /LENGTH=68 /DNA_ID=CAMNT_0023492511 /DNA_START=341 /DNA_END=547 /DNA_ORIENTATION=-